MYEEETKSVENLLDILTLAKRVQDSGVKQHLRGAVVRLTKLIVDENFARQNVSLRPRQTKFATKPNLEKVNN